MDCSKVSFLQRGEEQTDKTMDASLWNLCARRKHKKDVNSVGHERGTKKKSESSMGIEPMTFCTLVGCSCQTNQSCTAISLP